MAQTTKIKKILMANRGEISLRVLSTCREMGIPMVSVYTNDEADLPHATKADQSVCLGSGALSQTYLNQELLIQVARDTGCDAIHPGYGFLSENSTFARKVSEAGLIFIGPSPESMELMGDKQASKVKMKDLGVPLIPGYHGEDQTLATLQKEAQKIGPPLLIKASAGGGGKGMRIVRDLNEFESSLDSAKREAMNAFGDDRVLLERFIENPRHIEIQVFSDSHGNHLHLFERECSIQRRYQKVVEESPSPFVTQEWREKFCEAALKITRGLNYLGAGTIEFMADKKGLYFLEMNTRLQVEHPVTEMVTGLDLVKWQILAADGQKLPLAQDEIQQRGHALEVRLYAENADNDFMPTSGPLLAWGKSLLRHTRLDTGYAEGNDVGTGFDPMIAKLIVWGEDREEARKKMIQALKNYGPLGLMTNNAFLQRVLAHPKFISGETWTHFLQTHKDELKPEETSDEQMAQALAYALLREKSRPSTRTSGQMSATGSVGPWVELLGFRNT